MTETTALERRMRSRSAGPVDYDASGHVVTAAATVLRVRPRSHEQRQALFLLTHWGYGSAVAAGYVIARRHLQPVPAAALFWSACQTMAMTLFPTVGDTPPPWRWRRDMVVSSLAQHAVYAAVVAATDEVLPAPD